MKCYALCASVDLLMGIGLFLRIHFCAFGVDLNGWADEFTNL